MSKKAFILFEVGTMYASVQWVKSKFRVSEQSFILEENDACMHVLSLRGMNL